MSRGQPFNFEEDKGYDSRHYEDERRHNLSGEGREMYGTGRYHGEEDYAAAPYTGGGRHEGDISTTNYYVQHENAQPFNPKAQPKTFFYVCITGQIESGDFRDLDGLCCKFDFVAGNDIDWTVADGNSSGISQHSFKSQGVNKRIVWNFPFEITYRSLNVHGWP